MPMRTTAAGPAGFTLVEVLIVITVVGLLAAISMAAYRGARVRGNEAAAITALRAINDAQFAYAQACGNQRFAPQLTALGTPMPSTGQAFLSPDLTAADAVVHHGYTIAMQGTPLDDGTRTCTGDVPVTEYLVVADPITPGMTGMRFFATNTDRAIYEDSGTFTGNMPATGAPGHGGELK